MTPALHFWTKAPILRLLVPLSAGIAVQWNYPLPFKLYLLVATASLFLLALFFFLSLRSKFAFRVVSGILINFVFLSTGCMLTIVHDERNNATWVGKQPEKDHIYRCTLAEPSLEKQASWKAEALINGIIEKNCIHPASGRIIIYFKKDSFLHSLPCGTSLVLLTTLQPITNTGNPGSFDYRNYCLLHGITHQVYLTRKNFILLDTNNSNPLQQFVFASRDHVVGVLKKFIPGNKESGLAEALLIGYRQDLDKDLVQSYTNTGVVHIIAISGMHLALIYAMLLFITRPLKKIKPARVLVIIIILWLFSLMAGAQASVVRSALMFTCIAFGDLLSRKTSAFNSLAFSAFILLCYDPFWLWDAGFQLSYAAVTGILIYYKPIYNLTPLQNKLLDNIWKSVAISIAAQVFTTPVSLYHFHQFPLLFLLTNLVAIPLSSLVVFAAIFLYALNWMNPLAHCLGSVLHLLILWLNSYIERLEKISFALWDSISISLLQSFLLLLFAGTLGHCLVEKKKSSLWLSLIYLLLFSILRAESFQKASLQHKLIVYQSPRHKAIELVAGRTAIWLGEKGLINDPSALRFYLRPSEIFHRINYTGTLSENLYGFEAAGKRIAVYEEKNRKLHWKLNRSIDLLIISGNTLPDPLFLKYSIFPARVVIDSSVPIRKAASWKKAMDSLHIPCYDVQQKGAFVMNL